MAVAHVVHSIPPTWDERSRVLVLGTMPSPRSREEGFNYTHPRNRFWPVMARLADEPVPSTNERRRDFCLRHHIALWDVLAECDIDGASDGSIANAVPNPLASITQAAPIEAVYCTGAKAFELYNRYCAADVGIPAVKLPSTSPANATWSLDALVQAYAPIFEHEHPFVPPVLAVPDVVALEQTIAAGGTSLAELMDRAGTALAKRVREALVSASENEDAPVKGDSIPSSVVVLCGNGNNGGDGWVAARLLARDGVPVTLVSAKAPADITAQPAHDAAMTALPVLQERGARVIIDTRAPDDAVDEAAAADAAISQAHVVVDALMGTGSARAPREPFARWIRLANEVAGNVVIAADVPSGIDAQTGEVAEPHIVANETVTMIVPKPGLDNVDCGGITVAPLAYIEPLLA